MDGISRILVAYLLNCFWQVTLIAALTLLCSFYLRRLPGRYRHNLWVLCLAACVLVPAATVVTQVRLDRRARIAATAPAEPDRPLAVSRQGGWSFLSFGSRNRPVLFAPVLMNGLAFAYLALLLFRCGQLLWKYRQTSQIRNLAYEKVVPHRLKEAVEKCSELFGISSIPLLCAEQVESPSTVGWRIPVLLVPPSFFTDDVGEPELISALSHEMAHIRRRDFLLNLVYEVLSLPLCIHPATVLIKSRIAQTRELACDEMAASLLPSGKQYARSLLQLAQNIIAAAPSAKSNYAMGLFDTHVLEERIMNILRMSESTRRGSRIRLAVVCGVIATASILCSAFSLHVSADTSSDDIQRFVGTWVTKYKGQTFITLKIKSESGVLGGSVIHVDRLDALEDGELVPSSDHFTEQEIVQAKVSGNKMELRIGGHDSIYFEFNLTGPNAGEMRTVGDVGESPDQAPPQKKPWHFERIAEHHQ